MRPLENAMNTYNRNVGQGGEPTHYAIRNTRESWERSYDLEETDPSSQIRHDQQRLITEMIALAERFEHQDAQASQGEAVPIAQAAAVLAAAAARWI
jgi:hypothetical protein